MNKETKILGILGIVTIVALVGGSLLFSKEKPDKADSSGKYEESILVGANSYKKGPESAAVTVVEFADFECPACGASYQITKQIIDEYDDRVRFVFRQFPLNGHPYAYDAARAAEAAGAQGKFWEMHDKLYETQKDWESANGRNPDYLAKFETYAKELGLDVEKYKKDMTDKAFDNYIQAGLLDGTAAGVNATPTFFVNGFKKQGMFTVQEWKQILDSELSKITGRQ